MSSRKPKSKKNGRSKSGSSTKLRVLLSGPENLAVEWGTVLAGAGYAVSLLQVGRTRVKSNLPKGFTVLSRPDPAAVVAIDLTLMERNEKRKRIADLDAALPPDTVLLTNCLTIPVAEQATWIEGKHRLLGAGFMPTFGDRSLVEVAPCALTPTQTVEAAREFFRSCGKTIEVVQDRPGLVASRVICQIINEAAFALQEDVALPQDIDSSMKLGVSYPHGPFEWAEKIGVENVVAVLDALQSTYQEERYRVAPLLRSMSWGGTWWKRPVTEQPKADAL